jgi:hypothetical protein
MKLFLMVSLLLAVTTIKAQKLEAYSISVGNTDYTIRVGDTLQIGYGKNPYGSFQYIDDVKSGMTKDNASKKAIVKAIKYYKTINQYTLLITVQKGGTFWAKVPQAIEINEITGYNGTTFGKD